MKTRFLSACALLTMLFISACKDDKKELPANVIEDEEGLEIELTWTTGGTSTEAKAEADLDLLVFNEDVYPLDELDEPVELSISETDFEEVELEDLDDGEYVVIVLLYSNTEDTEFEVVIKGKDGSKEFKGSGDFADEADDSSYIELIRITKDGKRYTMEEF